MNAITWKSVVRKTKWASGGKKFGKKALCELMKNVMALEKFMGANKSNFVNANRQEHFRIADIAKRTR